MNDFEEGYDLGCRESAKIEQDIYHELIKQHDTTVWNDALAKVIKMLNYRDEQYIVKAVENMKK